MRWLPRGEPTTSPAYRPSTKRPVPPPETEPSWGQKMRELWLPGSVVVHSHEYSLLACVAPVDALAHLHRRNPSHRRHWSRRQYGHVQRDQWHPAQATAISGSRGAGGCLADGARPEYQGPAGIAFGLLHVSRREPVVRTHRRLDRGQRQRHRTGTAGTGAERLRD